MGVESNVQSDVIFHRIVVPHDLSEQSDRALELAGTMADPFHSEVLLLHVIDPQQWHQPASGPFMSELGHMARERWRTLQLAAKRHLPAEMKFDVRVLSGDPQEVILVETKNLGADLLIVTLHEAHGAGYPFRGGTVEEITRLASCAVLTLPIRDEDEVSTERHELKKFQTHNLKQYCDVSRRLSQRSAHRPVYLGYSTLPANPRGVCD